MNVLTLEGRHQLVCKLAELIDSDEPPGLAAHELARTIVSLVADRESTQAVLLTSALNELRTRFPRVS
jgi:hypothetical protein